MSTKGNEVWMEAKWVSFETALHEGDYDKMMNIIETVNAISPSDAKEMLFRSNEAYEPRFPAHPDNWRFGFPEFQN